MTSQTAFQPIFQCLRCGQRRQYGASRVQDTKYRPVLRCVPCGATIRHAFFSQGARKASRSKTKPKAPAKARIK